MSRGSLTPSICLAPENNRLVLVFGRTENIMELDSKPIEMTDVQWSEVVVEGIVQQAVIDGEVVRLDALFV
jgi:hypothetical protein